MARKRRKRQQPKKMADFEHPPELGQEQLPEVQPPTKTPEVPGAANEPDGPGRPHRGGRWGESSDPQAKEAVAGDVRNFQANSLGGPAEAQSGGMTLPLDHLQAPVGDTIRVDSHADPLEERLGHWPYRVVRSEDDVMALGLWLQSLGGEVDKTPVGIAVSGGELALAVQAQGYTIWHQSPLIQGVLSKALLAERVAPALVARDTGQLVAGLEEWLGEYDRKALLANIVHDMKVLEYTTGRAVAKDLPPLKDALDSAVIGPGMALGAPRFYREVGLPLTRFNSLPFHIGVDEAAATTQTTLFKGSRWTLTYDWLLFRVLAHYTRDPTLIRWFQEDKSPMQEFASYLELDSKQAIAFLLWMICGEEEELVSRYYPDWAALMPKTPQLLKASYIDKNLPNLRLGLLRLIDQYASSRKVTTLYGRHSPWGLRPQELLHFVIMGSVHDLLDVLMASVIKLGSDCHWLVPEKSTQYNHWLRATIVGYTQSEPMEWQRQLEQLGALNQPLGAVPLEPKVAVE